MSYIWKLRRELQQFKKKNKYVVTGIALGVEEFSNLRTSLLLERNQQEIPTHFSKLPIHVKNTPGTEFFINPEKVRKVYKSKYDNWLF